MSDRTLTTSFGATVPDNEHSLTAGERAPLLNCPGGWERLTEPSVAGRLRLDLQPPGV